MRLAVVGATGAVGSVMLEQLRSRAFPADEIAVFASARSAGRELDGGLVVQELTEEALDGFDLAIFSAGGSTSREWAPRFAQAGTVVVDNSSSWRMHEDVPLVVSEVNPDDLDWHDGIVANPNCSTMQLMVALKPLHDEVGIERLVVATYQSVSGTGMKAIEELRRQARAVLDGDPWGEPRVYAHQIAFNVLPHAGSFAEGDDHTDEERKLMNEARKILGDPDIGVSATCVRVPVVFGHSEAVNVQTRRPLDPERARTLLSQAPGVTVLDDPASGVYPIATAAAGRDEVFVGRIRRDPSHDSALDLWVVSDNIRKGAATNAVQLAELLVGRDLLHGRSGARASRT